MGPFLLDRLLDFVLLGCSGSRPEFQFTRVGHCIAVDHLALFDLRCFCRFRRGRIRGFRSRCVSRFRCRSRLRCGRVRRFRGWCISRLRCGRICRRFSRRFCRNFCREQFFLCIDRCRTCLSAVVYVAVFLGQQVQILRHDEAGLAVVFNHGPIIAGFIGFCPQHPDKFTLLLKVFQNFVFLGCSR